MKFKRLAWIGFYLLLVVFGFMVAKARGDTITLSSGAKFNGTVIDPHGFFLDPPSKTSSFVHKNNVLILIKDEGRTIGSLSIPASTIKSVEVNNKVVTRSPYDSDAMLIFNFIFQKARVRLNLRNYTDVSIILERFVEEKKLPTSADLFDFLRDDKYSALRKAVVAELKLPRKEKSSVKGTGTSGRSSAGEASERGGDEPGGDRDPSTDPGSP